MGVGGSFARTGLPAAVASAVYDAANRVLQFGGSLLTHDLNGNLTSDGAATYTWDARNRLAGLSGPGVTGSFAYDAEGRRVAKTINGTATGFLYDGLNPVQELNGNTPTANLLTGPQIDEYLSRDTGSGARTYLTDALGSTLVLASPTGAIETAYTYEPFGMVTLSGQATTNAFTFTGREFDATTLMYYRHRYYSSQIQRFYSEDPVGKTKHRVNLYEYAGGNPIRYVDPCGLDKQERCVSSWDAVVRALTCAIGSRMLLVIPVEFAMSLACAPTGVGFWPCITALHHAAGPALWAYYGPTWAACVAEASLWYSRNGCK